MKGIIIALTMFILLTTSALVAAIQNIPGNYSNVVYLWHFDDGSGSIANEEVSNLDFSLIGNYSWINSTVPAGSFYINMSNDSVEGITSAENALNSGVVSIVFWMKMAEANEGFIVGKWNDTQQTRVFRIAMGSNESGKLFAYVSSDGSLYKQGQWNHIFTVGLWYHVAIILDPTNNNCSLWVNGSYDSNWGCENLSLPLYNPLEEITVGYSTEQINNFDGGIDELAIFKKKLNESEIITIYNGIYGGFFYNINCTSCKIPYGDTVPPYETIDSTPTFTFNT